MVGGDPEQVLMQMAWRRLWEPGTKYYLPKAIVEGAQGNGIVVSPLGGLTIADTGSIPLFESSTWGNVAVELKNCTLGGLDTLGDGGMKYESESGAFSATVKIGKLTFAGQYFVTASGVAGCAIDTASALLKPFAHRRVAIAAAAQEIGATDDDLALAVSYREQLVGSSNGLDLVSTYYDHNETLNEIVSTDHVFQAAWTEHETAGEKTPFYAAQTSTAAKEPENPGATVGDTNYRRHSSYIRTVLIKRVELLAEKRGDPDGSYAALALAMAEFKGHTEPYEQPMTVSAVLDQVNSPSAPAAPLAAAALPTDADSVEVEAERQAEADLPMWEERGAALAAEQAVATGGASSVEGAFLDTIENASISFAGTVSVTGTPPDTSLSVALTSITAAIPAIKIKLAQDGSLEAAVEQSIADSHWFQQMLAKKVGDQLGSETTRNYLAERINQSISKALGEPDGV